MPHNEEGEFELVLGNKQLLSVFFLVVLLLGVFFSMGYIVGRNTAPTATTVATSKPPLVVDSSGSTPAPLPPVPTTTAAITRPPVE
ncbi:MAG: hypothetical protein IT162_22155, partial [Bryobacterales bacterium]|nr:hypothetical protein [Bryobacterales bacterium]